MYARIGSRKEMAPMSETPERDARATPHSGADLIRWLAANPVPPGSARSAAELDEQIEREREAWAYGAKK